MWKRLTIVLASLVVLLALMGAWTAFRVKADLATASRHAMGLQDAVRAGGQPAARRELADLEAAASSARSRTDGPVFSLLSHVPVVGDDLSGVRTISATLDDLANDALDPLLAAGEDLDAGAFTPRNGRISTDAISSIQEPVAAGASGFMAADSRLAAAESADFLPSLRTPYNDLRRTIHRTAGMLDAADIAVRLLPGMLGANAPRHYLLVVQNNAEIRATGGLPGAVSLLEADRGKVRLTRQMAGSAFPELKQPILPLTKEELALYDRQLGTYFVDANFTPDFPRAAELWRARWERDVGDRIDGVLSLDPVTLSYLLKATGPVKAPGGIKLTAENAVDELLNKVYSRLPDPEAQDKWFGLVAKLIFHKISSGVSNPQRLVQELSRGVAERRVAVHSFDNSEQSQLAGSAVAGELIAQRSTRPQVGVYLNSGSASKMSYYLRYRARITATWCKDGVQELQGRMEMSSDTPTSLNAHPRYVTGGSALGEFGTQLVIAKIYGPVGGRLKDLMFDGEPAAVGRVAHHADRPVFSAAVFLDPGQTVSISWRMVSGTGQTGDVDLVVTPGVEQRKQSSSTPSACTH